MEVIFYEMERIVGEKEEEEEGEGEKIELAVSGWIFFDGDAKNFSLLPAWNLPTYYVPTHYLLVPTYIAGTYLPTYLLVQ